MSAAILTAFTCGWLTLPASYFIAGEDGTVRVPAVAFLIDHPRGLALFDTGLGSRWIRPGGPDPRHPIAMETGDLLVRQIEAIGIDPGAIRWIVASHLHADHAGGNRDFPNATVVVQESEWAYARDSGDQGYQSIDFDIGQPLLQVRGEHDLFGDGTVILFPSPGHTPGHQSARVTTSHGIAILAADCCNMRRSLDTLRLPAECFDPEQYLATLKLLRTRERQGEHVLPGHDPVFWHARSTGRPLRIGSPE